MHRCSQDRQREWGETAGQLPVLLPKGLGIAGDRVGKGN